jgi:hypothetical protein
MYLIKILGELDVASSTKDLVAWLVFSQFAAESSLFSYLGFSLSKINLNLVIRADGWSY